MLRWFKSLFAWRRVSDAGPVAGSLWSYWENSITGERKAYQEHGGYQPLDWDWLAAAPRWRVVSVRGVERGVGLGTA